MATLSPLDRIGLKKDQVRTALQASRVSAAGRTPTEPATLTAPGISEDLRKFIERSIAPAPVLASVVNLVINVSPELAAEWLERNHNNRNPSQAKIKRFAAQMAAGKWTITGEPVKFTVAGELLDGQSRLSAVIESKTTVPLEVRWGLPRTVQETMDTGEARSHAHQLQMLGTRHPNEVAAALRIVWLWEQGILSNGSKGSARTSALLTNTTIRETLERHPKIVASVDRYGTSTSLRQLIPLSRAAAFHYLFSLVDAKASDDFWDKVADGGGLTKGAPVHLLRERLLADRLSQAKIQSREQFALIVKAWNAVRDRARLERLNFFNGTEIFPEISGLKRPASTA